MPPWVVGTERAGGHGISPTWGTCVTGTTLFTAMPCPHTQRTPDGTLALSGKTHGLKQLASPSQEKAGKQGLCRRLAWGPGQLKALTDG